MRTLRFILVLITFKGVLGSVSSILSDLKYWLILKSKQFAYIVVICVGPIVTFLGFKIAINLEANYVWLQGPGNNSSWPGLFMLILAALIVSTYMGIAAPLVAIFSFPKHK